MEPTENSLSTDALPMAPRPVFTENTVVTGSTQSAQLTHQTDQNDDSLPTEDFEEIPDPHPDWQFNIFLDEIAEGITTEDFKKMKHLFRGTDGIGEATLNRMETALDLFSIMRTRRLINRDNLIYLQAILQKVGRIDLVKQAVEYASTIGNVLHFYPASSLPENGFKYVKFHVEGRNFRNGSRSYVQHIRNKIASILFVPAEFVIIAGIEPSCSLLITLMIPELYVTILEEMLENCAYNAVLKELSIDKVQIEKVYTIGDTVEADIEDTDQQKKLANIYQQLEKKEKQLEGSEIERLRLLGELEKNQRKETESENTIFEDKVTMDTMKTIFLTLSDESTPASLSSQCALKEFQVALNQTKMVDKSVIQRLLSANTAVVANRIKESNRIKQQRLQLEVEELKSQLMPWILEVHKHRFFSEIDVSEMDRLLLESFKKLLQSFKVSVEVQLTEQGLQILKKISRQLRCREKEKLSKKYTWDQDDELKQTIDEDQSFFLAGILYKEINDKKREVDTVEFISRCLEEVGRIDLVRKFQDLAKGLERNTARSKKKRNTSQRHRSGSVPRTDGKENIFEQEEQFPVLQKVADQVQKIYDTIQANQKAFAPEIGLTREFGLPYNPPPYSRYPCRL